MHQCDCRQSDNKPLVAEVSRERLLSGGEVEDLKVRTGSLWRDLHSDPYAQVATLCR